MGTIRVALVLFRVLFRESLASVRGKKQTYRRSLLAFWAVFGHSLKAMGYCLSRFFKFWRQKGPSELLWRRGFYSQQRYATAWDSQYFRVKFCMNIGGRLFILRNLLQFQKKEEHV